MELVPTSDRRLARPDVTLPELPRLLIGAPRSGEGKTTVSLGIMAALHRRGLRVQGFKVGPDYLDTGYQRSATGRPGRTLDLWMMGPEEVLAAVASATADVAVIEGVMGLFDGHRDGSTPSSSADVAALVDAPVVLVVDASHTAASIGALAHGFATFDERVTVAGVVLNRWAPHRGRVAVERALAKAGVEPLGWLPPDEAIRLPSRHLGLCVADELGAQTTAIMARLAERLERHADLDRLLELATAAARRSAGRPTSGVDGTSDGHPPGRPAFRDAPRPSRPGAPPPSGERPVRIAVALDQAFAFYYEDNLREIRQAGAEIVWCSPLADTSLPACDGLYLGGGYPELHAERLSANESFRKSVAAAAADGLPVYAECGGLLYLAEQLDDLDGRTHPMVGAVPAKARLHRRLQNMGYREARFASDCLLGPAGHTVRGHEFHYSSCAIDYGRGGGPAYTLLDDDGRESLEGFTDGCLFASYIHLHFAGCRPALRRWLDACRRRRRVDRSTVALSNERTP